MINLLYKLLFLYKYVDVVDPEDVDYSWDGSGIETAGWFIVIFCFVLYVLGQREN